MDKSAPSPVVSGLKQLSNQITTMAESGNRTIIAIVGSPGSGKSTLVSQLKETLDHSVVVPMDGFHLDNAILEANDLISRKGSPQSFDSEGYYQLLSRLKYSTETVYAPMFDRKADLSVASAIEINSDDKVILTEGNYLLLNQPPWNKLIELFDLTVSLNVPQDILRGRLIQRWLEHDLTKAEAIIRAESNDLLNAKLVVQNSRQADVVLDTF